jgi:hypothetical protein
MRDFTLTTFKTLLSEFYHAGYHFMTFTEFVQKPGKKERILILRHDVDKKPFRSLRTANLEKVLGIKGTYYFRIEKSKFPQKVIERIAKLGHEIGYHYDDVNAAGGVMENALTLFQKNLAKLRELAQVKTACMHGSPLSKYDNRHLWQKFDYHNLGIIAEPYFDVDYNEVLYLTDTGRRWDGNKVSIRDKVIGDGLGVRGKKEDRRQKTEDREQNIKGSSVVSSNKNDPATKLRLHSTRDIINALENDLLPSKIMLTIHPQRWTDNYFLWIKELIWQNVKNGVKYLIIKDIW